MTSSLGPTYILRLKFRDRPLDIRCAMRLCVNFRLGTRFNLYYYSWSTGLEFYCGLWADISSCCLASFHVAYYNVPSPMFMIK